MKSLMRHPDVKTVVGHMCAHGMTLDHNGRKEKVYKPTGWCSNSPCIREHMHKLCTKDHKHISLQNGRAKRAAIYPVSLCLSILRGIKDQLVESKNIGINGLSVGTTCEERVCEDLAELQWQSMVDVNGKYFIDDVTGSPLPPALVRAARKEGRNCRCQCTSRMGQGTHIRVLEPHWSGACRHQVGRPQQR